MTHCVLNAVGESYFKTKKKEKKDLLLAFTMTGQTESIVGERDRERDQKVPSSRDSNSGRP